MNPSTKSEAGPPSKSNWQDILSNCEKQTTEELNEKANGNENMNKKRKDELIAGD